MLLLRCTSDNEDFSALVRLLDADLAIRDGEDHAFYHQFNKTAGMDTCLVGYLEGQPVACGAFKPWNEDAAEVKRMYVLPDMRGRGFAGHVLRELERWAAEKGYRRCVLETGKQQPEAIALYEKSGYTRIPNYGQYAGIENSVCFEKKIQIQDTL